MRWKGRRESANVEDRRGAGMGGLAFRGGIGTFLLVVVLALVFKIDPLELLTLTGQLQPAPSAQAPNADPNDEIGAFLRTLQADSEDVWTEVLAQYGRRYEPSRLVLYSGTTPMPGGMANAATGPFYYPRDRTIYLDTSFFDDMNRRFRAGGDFAYAYVLAHEVGHHIQNLLGYMEKAHSQRGRISETEFNRLSIRLELQADFLAGVWAHHAEEKWRILEPGDIEEAMNAANAIGDDRLQQQTQGRIVPDAFTHGTSEQRVRWFSKGLRSGRLEDGDTFSLPFEDL